MATTKYRDYFSLKTLRRFGVEPDRPLADSGEPEALRTEILAAFGNVSESDRAWLAHKTDCALFDLRITEPSPEREQIEVTESLEDDFLPFAETDLGNDAPTADRVL